ncbi:hypothetical protein Tco_0040239 [Tanacetum coccineum]
MSTDGTALEASLVTECAAFEASLITKVIALDFSLVAKQSTIDSSTSSEQQNECNNSRNECSILGNENNSFKNKSSSSGNDVDADIGPSYDSDTVSEVHHDIFENMLVHGIQNHEQPKSILDTYVLNGNNSNIIFDIPNMDPNRDKEEHDYVDYEQQRAFFASLINNLKCDVEKCTKVNHEARQANALLKKEHEIYKEKEKHFAKDKSTESKYYKKIKLLNDDISNLKSQACQNDKTFARENRKLDNHVYENEIFERNSSLENENRCVKKTITELSKQVANVKEEMTKRCAQYEKDFAKLEAHCISLEPKSSNKSSTFVQNGHVLSNKSNEAKIKFDTEYLETINIEMEYSTKSSNVSQNEAENLMSQLYEFADKKFDNVFQKIKSMKKKKFDSRISNDFLQRSLYDSDPSSVESESGEKKILFRNETSSFETKIKDLKMSLAQQTKDFEDAKVDFSMKTDKFKTNFENLKNTRVVLERQLYRKIQDSIAKKISF